MGSKSKVFVAVLVAAVCVYFVARTLRTESPPVPAGEPLAADVGVEEESPDRVTAIEGANVLRVVLEGIPEEDARRTRVTLTGVDQRLEWWPSHLQNSWPCQGSTSWFDLDPFFASVAGATNWDLQVDELEVKVCHPRHRIERVRVPLSRGVELPSGQTLHVVRVRLVPGAPHVFWPELTLDVRDAYTRAHLEDVELRCVPTAFMGLGQMPGTDPVFTSLGGGLSSPIALLGGREADGPEDQAAGLAVGPAAGEAPQLFELVQPETTDRGVVVYARAPGYAWGRIVLDVSTGAERELLLGRGAALDVQPANVQLERYAALETTATLWVDRLDPDGVERRAWHQRLDETLSAEGLRLEGLEPGEYAVSVKLDLESWKQRPVLAREELSLAAGETRALVLALADPPTPAVRATLAGVVSFPVFGGEEKVRLQFYYETSTARDPYVELSLDDLKRVGGTLPTWSFHREDLPVGQYRIQLLPFVTSWMIELPAGGREDVELVVPELAEVSVETVDARTGERIPLDEFFFRNEEALPGQVQNDWARADTEEPGRFRFWTAPGTASIWTSIPSGMDYGRRSEDLELIPGLQSVRFELAPVYAIRVEFRDGGTALPRDDDVWVGVTKGVRAVGHEGRVTINRLPSDRTVEVSAPGVYEISFEGIGADRFHPIPAHRVDVRPGETAEVIVELRRK